MGLWRGCLLRRLVLERFDVDIIVVSMSVCRYLFVV